MFSGGLKYYVFKSFRIVMGGATTIIYKTISTKKRRFSVRRSFCALLVIFLGNTKMMVNKLFFRLHDSTDDMFCFESTR